MEDVSPVKTGGTTFSDWAPSSGSSAKTTGYTGTRGAGWGTYSKMLQQPLSSDSAINQMLKQSFTPSWAKEYGSSGLPAIKYTGTAYSLWRQLAKGARRGPWGALNLLQALLDLADMLGDPWGLYGPPDAIPVLPPGWTLCGTPSCHGETDYYVNFVAGSGCATFGSCPSGQALPSTDHPNSGPGYVSNPEREGVILAKHENPDQAEIGSSGARYRVGWQMWHPLGATGNPFPSRSLPLPLQIPASWPDDAPAPEAIPAPYQVPELAPNQRPAENLHVTLDPTTPPGEPLPPSVPGTHTLRPDRSKKMRFKDSAALAVVSKVYGSVTEFKDFIDAVADAIPHKPCSGLKLAEKTSCVVSNIDDVNWKKAIKNLVVNQAQDWSIGKVNAWANMITQNPFWTKPVGPAAEYGSGGTEGADIPYDVSQQEPQWWSEAKSWGESLMQ